MGIFSWLARKPRRAEPYIIRYAIEGSGDFAFDIVEEASYQENLNRICGGKANGGHEIGAEASLMEPDNPYDPNAVRVVIEGCTVGYSRKPNRRLSGETGATPRVWLPIAAGLFNLPDVH